MQEKSKKKNNKIKTKAKVWVKGPLEEREKANVSNSRGHKRKRLFVQKQRVPKVANTKGPAHKVRRKVFRNGGGPASETAEKTSRGGKGNARGEMVNCPQGTKLSF